MPAPQFTPAEVAEIRHQQARGRLDVRVWADTKRCSIETVRRVARGDTYRHMSGQTAHPSFGGLQAGASLPSARPVEFTPPGPLLPIDSILPGEDEDAEAAASFARLQASLAMPVPGDPQASQATTLLDELQALGESQRPAKVLPEGGV